MQNILSFIFLLFLNGCVHDKMLTECTVNSLVNVALPTTSDATPREYEGLHQIVAYQDWLLSGSKPKSEKGFQTLENLQVQTIVCVDGVPPDDLVAREHGIQTIHIPLKYGEPTEAQIFLLASAVHNGMSRGMTYIHCHHGKHRSAAAAAVSLIALGLATPAQMKDRMLVSETSKQYKGLWKAVETQQRIDLAVILRNEKPFSSCVTPEGITSQMVAIDEAVDRLRLIQDSNWKTPTTHPDLAPAADAGFIAELFREIQLGEQPPLSEVAFTKQLTHAIHQAAGLEEAIIGQSSPHKLNRFMKQVEQSCIDCHTAFRK